ncbi:MAG: hypothetical protein GX442_13005 [Candidatus Riflebacteria bacterium]|nr:hypothetical protein [Candidatus Riflebacteria bacterium]
MKSRLTIHEAAVAELEDAADFYDLENPGLGTLSLDALARLVEEIPGTLKPV